MLKVQLYKITSRILTRYIPALGTLVFSKSLVETRTVEEYATFALLVSLSAVVPVLDFGGGTKSILVSGEQRQVASLLCAPTLLTILLGILYLIIPSEITLSIFFVSLPIGLYIVARGNYARGGADKFNKRSLFLYPLGFVSIISIVQTSWYWSIYASALFTIYFFSIAGLEPSYLRKTLKLVVQEEKWIHVCPNKESVKLTLLALIAFAGVWGNITYLQFLGMAAEVKEYDLIWRIISITFFAQIYLSHSLPEVVELSNSKKDNKIIYILVQFTSIAAILSLVQIGLIVLVLPEYAGYFNFELNWGTARSGLFMCFVFSIFIPINHILLARNNYAILALLLGSSASLSVLMKFFMEPTAANAFLSSGLGYLPAVICGLTYIWKQRKI